jgi:signal transduction histidine kinase
LALSIFWLLFTVTFAGWWFVLEMRNVDRLIEVDATHQSSYERQRRMIFWEGVSWELLLIAGGATLIFLVFRERQRTQQVKEFFASFSHDIKTSLASLRLQAEALEEDLNDRGSPLLSRLVSDTVRLQLQLENSLYFAAQDSLSLYLQDVDFAKIVQSLQHQWPSIQLKVAGSSVPFRVDERALRSVINNLIQNSLVHGRARTLNFNVVGNEIHFEDDGDGFSGEVEKLGKIFHRPSSTSGSGLGLYIAKALLAKMNGHLHLENGPHGFGGRIQLAAAHE